MEANSTADGAEEQLRENYLPNAAGEGEPRREMELVEALPDEEEEVEHQPLEAEDLNFEKWKPKPKPKKTFKQKMAELKKYVWNPETREFMGRSGKSWSLILLFYSVLYAFLAAMFAACMWALMWSINPYAPTYNDRVMPPGMMMLPRSYNGFDISFNASDVSSWIKYVETLQEYLKPYDDALQEQQNVYCTKEGYYMQEEEKESAQRRACQFKRSWLKDCSGLQDPDFGYSQGKPCVLLKMNRVRREGTMRTALRHESPRSSLKAGAESAHKYDFSARKEPRSHLLRFSQQILGYLPGQGTPVYVTCTVKVSDSIKCSLLRHVTSDAFTISFCLQKGEQKNIGIMEFYPSNVFKLMYYPYYGKLRHVNYTNPLVAVRFSEVQLDTQISVQCKLHGKGIINDSPTDRFLGSVSFTLLVGA
ncbi:protein ATP1B4-like [Scleropages formosus]|uniref:Protein ATP1B4 n=1 Tax=Scleropages formosus TaxID=113540 RepID=A0A0P7V2D7_SCLFO|nr:protein ATP1B4-like [Scleropages formosus]